jgi:hypothetical protein
MVNLDAGLIESHKRAKTHAVGNQNFNPFLSEVIHRGHAASLLMGNIGDNIHLFYFAALDGNQSVEITMPEMGAHNRFKSTRISGWYGNQSVHFFSLYFMFSLFGRLKNGSWFLSVRLGCPFDLTVLISFQCLADRHIFKVLADFDVCGLQDLKRLWSDKTGQYRFYSGSGYHFRGLNTGALTYGLGCAIIYIFENHAIGVDDDKSGSPPEAGIKQIIQSGSFTAYGNFIHGYLLSFSYSRIIAAPRCGHFFCVHGTPVSCDTFFPHCEQRQEPPGPPAEGPIIFPRHCP